MNKTHAIWTVLPDGYAEPGVVKLSMVVSLRVAADSGKLGDLPGLLDWPAQVRVFDTVNVLVDGAASPVAAKVVSDEPRSELWTALFGPDTPVQLDGGGEVDDIAGVGSSVLFRPLTQTLRGIYSGATAEGAAARATANGGNGGNGGNGAGNLGAALSGLAAWTYGQGGQANGRAAARALAPTADAAAREQIADLLDPTSASTASLERAAELLRGQGLADAAAVVPLVPVLRRLRGAAAPGGNGQARAGQAPAPGRLDKTRTVDEADFHQILGLVAAHPTLAIPLGLRIDLTMQLSAGAHGLQVIGMPSQIAGGAPVSRVIADPATGRFTMATEQGAPTEIVNGMLDLRPEGPGADKYVVTTMDVVGMTQQLDTLARSLRAPGNNGGTPALPPRRNFGITVAQVDRRATTVDHTVARGTVLADGFGRPDSVEVAQRASGEVELFADDVTAGYRVDVRTDGGEWRSLMRRLVSYRVGKAISRAEPPITLTADDEAVLDPMVAVEQRDAAGAPVLEVGEDLLTWDGDGLAARRPGTSLTTDPSGRVTTEVVQPQFSQRYPLAMNQVTKPGTLPRLRYGRSYEFRIRGADLAGNSIAPELCDERLVSPGVVYKRLDPVPAPAVVPRAPFTAGESLLRLVVRSKGDGTLLGGTCERHLAAPRAWQHLAELHGQFDAAMGPRATPADRDRALALGALEAGSFLDTDVPDPADPTRRVAQPGIRVAVNADDPEPPTGSLDGLVRGRPLPAGEYVVLDSDNPHLPYLADPLATGVAASGLPSARGDGAVVVPFGGRHPVPSPVRLVAKPGAGDAVSAATPTAPGGRQVLEITVPRAATVVTRLSSTLDDAGLDLMEIDLNPKARPGALAGQAPLLTPAEPVTIVHAVMQPLEPLGVTAATVAMPKAGETTAEVSGSAECHPASTARIDVVARWKEVLDDGVGPVTTEQRDATAGTVTVPEGAATVSWKVRQSLGDTRRRDITYSALGGTRFREYFSAGTRPDQLTREGTGVVAVVPNTARPEAPVVHSTVPLFRWERKTEGGVFTSTRRTSGLRVWLARPWHDTGTGERLGVVVYRDPAAGDQLQHGPRHDRVTRWAEDPLGGFGNPSPHLLPANFPGHVEPRLDLPVAGQTVVGFPVHFDEASDRWFADVEFDLGAGLHWFPFLRLALVRYQPVSAPGCHVSSVVVTAPVQLPAKRTLTAKANGADAVDVTVTGRWIGNNVFRATVYDRATAASDVLVPSGGRSLLSHPPDTNEITVTGKVSWRRQGPPDAGLADRIAVRELQWGDSLHHDGGPPVGVENGPAHRVVWVEVIDRLTLGAGAGSAVPPPTPPTPPATPPPTPSAPPAPPAPPKPGPIRMPGKR